MCLGRFRYVFGKNYGWGLCAIKNMYKIFGSCVVAFQSVFYLEMHQNNFFYFFKIIFYISASKWSENTKTILIWSKKKLIFFKSAFEIQRQTEFYEIQLQKHIKTAYQKLRFKLNFLMGPTVKNIIWCVI